MANKIDVALAWAKWTVSGPHLTRTDAAAIGVNAEVFRRDYLARQLEQQRVLPGAPARPAVVPDRGTAHQGEDESLTAKQVARLLNCSLDSVYELRYSGLLRSTKKKNVGVRFRRSDVEKYMAPDSPPRPSRPTKSTVRVRSGSRASADELLPGLTREEIRRKAGF